MPSSPAAPKRMVDGSGVVNVMLSKPWLFAPMAPPVSVRVFSTPMKLVLAN